MNMRKTLAAVILVCLGTQVWAQQTDRELFNEAERRFQSQAYELAIDRYDTLIREYPVSQYIPDAQFRKAVSLYRLGRLDEALALLDLVSRRYRSSRYLGYVPFWRGVILYENGDYAGAVDSLTAFVQDADAPDSGGAASVDRDLMNQAHLYVALSQTELGQPDLARRSLETLLADESAPTDEPYPLSLLLGLYIQAGEYVTARALFDSINPDSLAEPYRSQVMLYGAEALNGSGETASAQAIYRTLVSGPPEVATVAYQRLFQYAQAGLITETSADILRQAEQALAGRTDILKELWLRVGIDSYDQGRYDVAELYFRRIWDFRKTEPIPASVPLYLSRLLDQRGYVEEAATVLDEYLQTPGAAADERLRVLIALGNLQIRTGAFGDAVATLSSAVDDFPESQYYGEAAYQYAFALRGAGRPADALAVIDAAFESGKTSGSQAEFLRLRARILREVGDDEAALQALFEYLPLRPSDSGASLEYVTLLFELGRHDRVLEEGPAILAELDRLEALSPSVRAQMLYVIGLSEVSLKRYDEATGTFASVLSLPDNSDPSVASLLSYAQYYRGWAYYRLGEYEPAAVDFEALITRDADHPLAADASYLAGWSYFRMGEYEQATLALARVRTYSITDEVAVKVGFLLGRSLEAAGSLQQAAAEFRSLYLGYPESEYADDSWFEYAQTQAQLGNTDAAVAAFESLLNDYPDSELAEPAVFRRAELLFAAGRYAEARDGYFNYRTLYPSGDQVDAALYWGGQASARIGEKAGAILLWERLASDHRGSPFRADAMQEAAALHAERGEYRQALNLYTELQAGYPEVAASVGAQRRIDELVLLINGLSQREAELYVTIESSGVTADAGRQAVIELARIAIYEDTASGIDAATIVPLLESVAAEISAAPAYASQALFMLGEYYSRQDEYLTAADNYLAAAGASRSDRDLAALSIYRAAEMYHSAGRTSETALLIERLEKDFPASQWLEEARTLLGGTQ